MDRTIYSELFIGRPDGTTWEDVSSYLKNITVDLGSVDMVGTGTGADSPIRQCNFTLQNEDAVRFSPRDQSSPVNQFGGSYAPLLWPNREVWFRMAAVRGPGEGENLSKVVGTTEEFEEGSFSNTFAENNRVRLSSGTSGTYTIAFDITQVRNVDTSLINWSDILTKYYYDSELERDSETVIEDEEYVVGDSEDDGTLFWNLLFDTTAQEVETNITAESRLNGSSWQSISKGGSIPQFVQGLDVYNSTLEIRFTLTTPNADFSPELHQIELDVDWAFPWVTLFHGLLGDQIQSKRHSVSCSCRDFGKILQDTYIEEEREYGDSEGQPAEQVIQEILNDNITNPPTLYLSNGLEAASNPFDSAASGFMVFPYELDYKSVWDAVQEIAHQIGWFLGYRKLGGEFKLVWMEPPRTKDTPDIELSADENIYLEDLDISDADVRNAVTISFRGEDGKRVTLTPEENEELIDQASVAAFGRRAMAIEEADTSFIKTEADAIRLGEAAIWDLASLNAETRIEMPIEPLIDLFWTLETSNPLVSSTSDLFAVESLRHELNFDSGRFRTEVVASGRVIGGKRTWLNMQSRPGARKPIEGKEIEGETLDIGRFASDNRPIAFVDDLPELPDVRYPLGATVFYTEDGWIYTNRANQWRRSVPYARYSTVVVAAVDAPEEVKANADFVCDGVDDQAEITLAIESAMEQSVGRGTVKFSEGTFELDGDLFVSLSLPAYGLQPRLKLVGEKDSTTFKQNVPVGSGESFIFFSGATAFLDVKGITFRGTEHSGVTGANCVRASCNKAFFDECTFERSSGTQFVISLRLDINDAVVMNGSPELFSGSAMVQNCRFEKTSNAIYSTGYLDAKNCFFKDVSGWGILTNTVNPISIVGNLFKGITSYGVYMYLQDSDEGSVLISNNKFTSAGERAIYLDLHSEETGTVDGMVAIETNQFRNIDPDFGNDHEYAIFVGPDIFGTLIVANDFYNGSTSDEIFAWETGGAETGSGNRLANGSWST